MLESLALLLRTPPPCNGGHQPVLSGAATLEEAVRHSDEREPSNLSFRFCAPPCARQLFVRGTVGIVGVAGETLLDNEPT